MLCRNKACFPRTTILSRIDYGDVIYMHSASSSLKLLDTVYHAALRFITGHGVRTHHCSLYLKVGWSLLAMRRKQHCCLFIYKALLGKLPGHIASLLNFWRRQYHLRALDYLVLDIPRVHTKLLKLLFGIILHRNGIGFNIF